MSAVDIEKLLGLVRNRRFDAVELDFTRGMQMSAPPIDGLMSVLAALVRAGQADQAEMLGWTWLSDYRSHHDAAEALKLGMRLLAALPGSGQLRVDLAALYRVAWPDRADSALAASGLESGQTADRALRVLQTCATVKVGSYVVERIEGKALEVVDFDASEAVYSLKAARGPAIDVPARDLTYHYEPVGEDDFRVLQQMDPDALSHLLVKSPANVALSVVKSHGGEMTSDQLQDELCPRYVDNSAWSKWWTKARTALRKSGRVRFEGRSPVVLIYDDTGAGLEHHLAQEMGDAAEPIAKWQAIRKFLKEQPEDLSPVAQAAADLAKQVGLYDDHHPLRALQAAAVVDWLRAEKSLAGMDLPASSTAKLVTGMPDAVQIAAGLSDGQLWQVCLTSLRRDLAADAWPTLYEALIAVAPPAMCEAIAKALLEADHANPLRAALERAISRPATHFGVMAWLWQETKVDLPAEIPNRVELLIRILDGLDQLSQVGADMKDFAHVGRTKLRSAITARKCTLLRQCLTDMADVSMAIALRRKVDRCRGLSEAGGADIRREISNAYPNMHVVKVIDPWDDEGTLYVTAKGYERRQLELKEIVDVKMRQNAIAIGAAAEHGDLSENSEYKFALEERDFLRARVAQIQSEMAVARVLNPSEVITDRMSIGCTVTLKDTTSGQCQQVTILGPWEANPDQGVYNYKAPLCRNLLGRRVGDLVELVTAETSGQYVIETIEVGIG